MGAAQAERVAYCECGNEKRPGAAACDRCAHLESIRYGRSGVGHPVYRHLLHVRRATVGQIAIALGRRYNTVHYWLIRSARKGLVRRAEGAWERNGANAWEVCR